MNHTPGPWTIEPGQSDRVYLINNRHKHAIGEIVYSDTRKAADAHLIKAAPDMLNALYTALPFLEDALDDATYNRDKVSAKLQEIKDAIKKAQGKL